MPTPALLVVFLEPGPNTNLEEFHEWYNTEHIPIIQTCPGFTTFVRYNVLTEGRPPFAAIYDMESKETVQGERWIETRKNASPREKRILGDLSFFHTQVYELEGDVSPIQITTPSRGLVLEWSSNPNGVEEAGHAKREKTLEGVEGFVRARRFKLVEFVDRLGQDAPSPPDYLLVHEYSSEKAAHAVESVWGSEVQQRKELGLLMSF